MHFWSLGMSEGLINFLCSQFLNGHDIGRRSIYNDFGLYILSILTYDSFFSDVRLFFKSFEAGPETFVIVFAHKIQIIIQIISSLSISYISLDLLSEGAYVWILRMLRRSTLTMIIIDSKINQMLMPNFSFPNLNDFDDDE